MRVRTLGKTVLGGVIHVLCYSKGGSKFVCVGVGNVPCFLTLGGTVLLENEEVARVAAAEEGGEWYDTHARTHSHTRTHTHTHTYRRTHMHTHIHAHTLTH